MFKNRVEAATMLSQKLGQYKNTNSLILAIPRGGVPVGFVLSRQLHLPLDIFLAKKIGYPGNKEYAIGAVTTDDIFMGNHPEIPEEYYVSEAARIRKTFQERYSLFRKDQSPVEWTGKTVILTDDGIATGKTLLVCLASIRRKKPAKIVVAVPVAPADTAMLFRKMVDEFICLIESENFSGVGQFYMDFAPVTDEEVLRILSKRE